MAITCCKDCKAPKRYPGCHDHCPAYQEAKAIHDQQREAEYKRHYVSDGINTQIATSIRRSIRNKRSGHAYKTKSIK